MKWLSSSLLPSLGFWWFWGVHLLSILTGAQGEDAPAEWAGCYDASDSLIKIGSPMFLCLHVANGLSWKDGVDFIRLSFSPEGDQYSRLHIPNSYSDLRLNGDNPDFTSNSLTVGVGVQTKLSFLRVWADADERKIYPHLTAIIDVKDGVVRGITWDDACVFCSGFECDEVTYDFNGNLQSKGSAGQPTGGCGISESECEEKQADGSTDCDLNLHVVWTGTDVDGKSMLSSAYRYSAFPAQELSDRFTQNLPDPVKQAGNDVTNRRDL